MKAPAAAAAVSHLEVAGVLLEMLLHAGAELQDPVPLGLHGRPVRLQTDRYVKNTFNRFKSITISLSMTSL